MPKPPAPAVVEVVVELPSRRSNDVLECEGMDMDVVLLRMAFVLVEVLVRFMGLADLQVVVAVVVETSRQLWRE
jgi:hypothetical protein